MFRAMAIFFGAVIASVAEPRSGEIADIVRLLLLASVLACFISALPAARESVQRAGRERERFAGCGRRTVRLTLRAPTPASPSAATPGE